MNIWKPSVASLGMLLATFVLANASIANAAPSVADTLGEELSQIVTVCKPTDAQQETLKEKFKVKQAALEAWDKANEEKVKTDDDAVKAARKGTDDAAKRKANADHRALMAERQQAAAEPDKAIFSVLSDEQNIALAGVKMADATLLRCKKANLTEDQISKIRAACDVAARELRAISGDDRKDKQAKTTIQKNVKWAVDNVILTAEQRALIAPKPATPPAAAPK